MNATATATVATVIAPAMHLQAVSSHLLPRAHVEALHDNDMSSINVVESQMQKLSVLVDLVQQALQINGTIPTCVCRCDECNQRP